MTLTTQSIGAELGATLDEIARGAAYGTRSPLLHKPSDQGLAYEEFSFPSLDGTPLEAWFIPADSKRLVVCAHAYGFNRARYPSGLEPWHSSFGAGNDYDIDFIPDYKILHDAGFNVLAFDFRNFGQSGAANGGAQSAFRYEARDVVGALNYVRTRPDTADMSIGIFARCMGADATFRAIHDYPAAFEGVNALVAPLLLSPRAILSTRMHAAGLGECVDEVDRRQRSFTSVWLDEASPRHWAPSVTIPTLTYGVRHDHLVGPDDLTSIYNAIGAKQKELFWIEDTTARWDGYTWFQRHPDRVLQRLRA